METAVESSSGCEENMSDSLPDMLQQVMYDQGVLTAPKEKSKPICDICNKEFRDNFKLKRHMLVHTGEKPFSCDLCDVRFSRKEGVERHMLREHKGIEWQMCPYCPKKYLSKTSLDDHMKTHEEKDINQRKIYPCDMCDAAFVSHGNLAQHQTIHTGIRSYACEICNKSFAGKSKLNRHMAIHSEIRAYSCTLCEKTFRTSDSLNRHRKIHTGEGFPCDICGAIFSERYKLQRHIETHMNKVAETCTFCGKFFNSSKIFAKHLEVHERKGHTLPGNYMNTDDASNSILEDLCEVDTSVEIDEESYLERGEDVEAIGIASDEGDGNGDGESVEEGFIDCGNFFQAEMVEGGNDDNRSEDEEPISVEPDQYDLEDNDNATDVLIEGEDAHENYYNGAEMDGNIGKYPCTEGEMGGEANQELFVKNEIIPPDESDLIGAKSEDFPAISLSNSLPNSLTDSLPSTMTDSFPDMLTQVMYEQGVLPKSSPNKEKSKPICEICNKEFRDNFKLKRHMSVHTLEKPFECDLCNSRFARKENLVKHKILHTEGNLPRMKILKQCNICRKTLRSMYVYSKHMKNHMTRGEMGLRAYQELLDSKEINPIDKDNSDLNEHSSTMDVNEFTDAHNDFISTTADVDIPSEGHDKVNVMIKQETRQQPDFVNYNNIDSVEITSVEVKQEVTITNFPEEENEVPDLQQTNLNLNPYLQTSLAGNMPKVKILKHCNICDKTLQSMYVYSKHMKNHMTRGEMGLPAYQELLDSKEINPIDKDNSDLNGHSSTTEVNEFADEDIPSEAHDKDNVIGKQETDQSDFVNYKNIDSVEITSVEVKQEDTISNFKEEESEVLNLQPQSLEFHPFVQSSLAASELQNIVSEDIGGVKRKRKKKIGIFSCTQCEKQFKYRDSLTKHMRRHTGNVFTCDLCPKVFTENSHLNRHKESHNNKIDAACPVCNHPFTSLTIYNNHMINHQVKGEIELESDSNGLLVGKPVKLKLLNLNSSTPTVEAPNIKPVRPRPPRRPAENNLAMTKTQMRLLNQQPNKKTFTCESCDKIFLKRNSLYNHMKLHTGNTLSCPYCTGVFTENYKLKRHMKVHEKQGGLLTGYSTEQSQHIEDNFVQPGEPSLEPDLQYDFVEYNNAEDDNDYIINDIGNPLIQNDESEAEEMDTNNDDEMGDYSGVDDNIVDIKEINI